MRHSKRSVKGRMLVWRCWSRCFYIAIALSTFVLITYFYIVDNDGSKVTTRSGGGQLVHKIVSFAEDLLSSKHVCHNLTRDHKINRVNQLWQNPEGSQLYIFSAHYDTRYKSPSGKPQPFIRVIASHYHIIPTVYCQTWYRNHGNQTNVMVHTAESVEIWSTVWDRSPNKYYRPYLISCPVTVDPHLVTGISISLKPCTASFNYFKITPSSDQTVVKQNFAVCVKGLNFATDISLRLIEWIEIQLLLGADLIHIYVFKVHPVVMATLKHYEKLGKVVLSNLTLPGVAKQPLQGQKPPSNPNIWQKRRHELIPYNDCLYTHLNSHIFVILLDLDEIIIPVATATWTDMYNEVVARQPRDSPLDKYASFSAQNVYFFDQFGVATETDVPSYHYILRHVRRSANFSRPGYAVKSFFLTNSTLTAFNHYALTTLYPRIHRNAMLSVDQARLHHYRSGCPDGMQIECDHNFMKFTVKDTIIDRWKEQLVARVNKTLDKIGLKP